MSIGQNVWPVPTKIFMKLFVADLCDIPNILSKLKKNRLRQGEWLIFPKCWLDPFLSKLQPIGSWAWQVLSFWKGSGARSELVSNLNELALYLDQSEFEHEKCSNSGKFWIFEYTFLERKVYVLFWFYKKRLEAEKAWIPKVYPYLFSRTWEKFCWMFVKWSIFASNSVTFEIWQSI